MNVFLICMFWVGAVWHRSFNSSRSTKGHYWFILHASIHVSIQTHSSCTVKSHFCGPCTVTLLTLAALICSFLNRSKGKINTSLAFSIYKADIQTKESMLQTHQCTPGILILVSFVSAVSITAASHFLGRTSVSVVIKDQTFTLIKNNL